MGVRDKISTFPLLLLAVCAYHIQVDAPAQIFTGANTYTHHVVAVILLSVIRNVPAVAVRAKRRVDQVHHLVTAIVNILLDHDIRALSKFVV